MDRWTTSERPVWTDWRAWQSPADSYRGRTVRRESDGLTKPVPGRLFEVVKWVSWIELAIFAALLAFWLLPGFDHETFIFGLTHGIGYILLCLLIWVTALRHEAPYTLLAATLTPVGPLGSVIAIELIERKGWGVAQAPPASIESR
jgi:hypothetical protein